MRRMLRAAASIIVSVGFPFGNVLCAFVYGIVQLGLAGPDDANKGPGETEQSGGVGGDGAEYIEAPDGGFYVARYISHA